MAVLSSGKTRTILRYVPLYNLEVVRIFPGLNYGTLRAFQLSSSALALLLA